MLIRLTEWLIYNTESNTLIHGNEQGMALIHPFDPSKTHTIKSKEAWERLCAVADAQDITQPPCASCGSRPANNYIADENKFYCDICP